MVEARKRLVQQQGLGFGQKAAHQGHAGALTARQGCRVARAKTRQINAGKCGFDFGRALGSGATGAQAKAKVLSDGKVREQHVILKEQPDLADLGWQGRDIDAVELDLSRGGKALRQRTNQRGQQCGFARPRRSHDGQHLTGRDMGRQANHGCIALGNGQLVEGQAGCHGFGLSANMARRLA